MVEDNGHPLSWSAIVNGRFDPQVIRGAGYGVIADYLSAQPATALGLAGARITHVWCDRDEDAQAVARSAGVQNRLRNPLEAIGRVDAVVIPTDKGEEHVERARPFIEAGLPVMIDKPLAINADDLNQFVAWHQVGRRIFSCSAMRFAKEFVALRQRLGEVGQPRLVVATCAKGWERYGVHALEAVYGLLPPGGWLDACNTGSNAAHIVHLRHDSRVDVVIAVTEDMFGGFCHVTVYGTSGRIDARFSDSFYAFKAQLQAYVDFVRGGGSWAGFEQTAEQCKILIASLRSREDGGVRYKIDAV